jgi:hypothetical protein
MGPPKHDAVKRRAAPVRFAAFRGEARGDVGFFDGPRHVEVPVARGALGHGDHRRHLEVPDSRMVLAHRRGMPHSSTFLFLACCLAACSGSGATPVDAAPDAAAIDATPDAAPDAISIDAAPDACIAPTAPPPVDCVGTSCAPIVIAGGPDVGTTGFRGYADASLRKDPGSARVWMGYSFVQPVAFDNGQGGTKPAIQVASHLAHTDDGGATWTFDKIVFPATPAPASTGVTGFFNSETISLAPASATSWYASRLAYLSETFPDDKLVVSTFMVRISHAASPAALGGSTEQVIGLSSALPAGYGAATDLNALSGLSCAYWNDPSLFYRNGTLYLTAECVGQGTIHVFTAPAVEDVSRLVWADRGALTTPQDARALGDDELDQADLEQAADGTLLVTVTPSHVVPGQTLATHAGCRTLRVASLDPPVLERACGVPTVVASVTASDTASTGSCGYDAHTTGVGLVLARRPNGAQPGVLVRSQVP